jgi:hypothetical protein
MPKEEILTIKEYCEQLELSRYNKDKDGFTNEIVDNFNKDADYRRSCGWDEEAQTGLRIMTSDLDYGVFGNRKTKRQFNNYLKTNIYHKAAQLLAADADIRLENDDGTISDAQEALEMKLNHAFDRFEIMRNVDQVPLCNYFFGLGVARQYWDTGVHSHYFRTGIPRTEAINPLKVFVNAGIQRSDMSDVVRISHRERYTKQKLLTIHPEYKEQLEGYRNVNGSNWEQAIQDSDHIDVVITQYKRTFLIEQRTMVDEAERSSYEFTEDSFQEWLQEKATELGLAVPTEEQYVQLINKAMQQERNEILPEDVVFTEKQEVQHNFWFQVIHIPQLNLIISPPELVGYRSEYILMPGEWNPTRSYPSSLAWDNARKLELDSAVLSMEFLATLKAHRPIPVLVKDALVDPSYVMENITDPELVVQVKQDFVKAGNHAKEAFGWLDPPQVNQLAVMLEDKLKSWIDEGTRAVPAMKGIHEAAESGSAIRAKQKQAKQGDKIDITRFEKFFKDLLEVLKNHLAEYMDFKHTQDVLDVSGNLIREVINDENNPNSIRLKDIAKKTFVAVTLRDNAKEEKLEEKNEAFALFDRHAISAAELNRIIDPKKADARIKELREEQGVAQLYELMQTNPEIMQVVQNYLRQSQNSSHPNQRVEVEGQNNEQQSEPQAQAK